MYLRAFATAILTLAAVLLSVAAVWPAIVDEAPVGEAVIIQAQRWVQDTPPWLAVLIVVTGVAVLGRKAGDLAPVRRDDRRLFVAADRARSFALAQWRCEHQPLLGFRCARPATDADHVVPWSRGGPTVASNCQALCRHHNSRKSDRMPSLIYVWRLERRRRKYYPHGSDVKVQLRTN